MEKYWHLERMIHPPQMWIPLLRCLSLLCDCSWCPDNDSLNFSVSACYQVGSIWAEMPDKQNSLSEVRWGIWTTRLIQPLLWEEEKLSEVFKSVSGMIFFFFLSLPSCNNFPVVLFEQEQWQFFSGHLSGPAQGKAFPLFPTADRWCVHRRNQNKSHSPPLQKKTKKQNLSNPYQ